MNIRKIKEELKSYPSYRLKQVRRALFQKGVSSWEEVSTLPKPLRKKLKKEVPLRINGDRTQSKNGKTSKISIVLDDGFEVESVLMKHEKRNTVCVSSQAGCRLGCKFCATGKMGFKRNLRWDEIIMQAYYFLSKLPEGERIDNIVFMGMGEPFLNYEAVMKAIGIFNSEDCFNMGARNLSISTVGIPSKIKKFTDENIQVNLAISLHAPDNELRSRLVPVNDKYPLENVFEAVDHYLNKTNRKIMFEYLLLHKVNDGTDQARQLAKLIGGRLSVVNLISYNPTGDFKKSSEKRRDKFKKILKKEGIEVSERKSFGRDINGACGQLAN